MAPTGALSASHYSVAVICPLEVELAAMRLMLDSELKTPSLHPIDKNAYTCGKVEGHNVVLVNLPLGTTGNVSAANVVNQLVVSFPHIRVALLVGIGGGIPPEGDATEDQPDIRLGDVIVGYKGHEAPAVIHIDSVRTRNGKLKSRHLRSPDQRILNHLEKLRASITSGVAGFVNSLATFTQHRNKAFRDRYSRPNLPDENLPVRNEDFKVYFGTIASSEKVISDRQTRDRIRDEHGAICIEMEAVGVLGTLGCLVIRGISDFADGNKDDKWQAYSASTAAVVARELLSLMEPIVLDNLPVQVTREALCCIPFRSDPLFVERQKIFKQVLDRCPQNGSHHTVLVGLGGVG